MKLSNICTVALAVAALTSFAAEPVITADARLKDGSTIKGEFVTKSIEGSTLFAPKLSLDPATIRSLSFTGTNGEAKVELTNSDRFAIKVANDKFALYSLLGDLAIPRANFRSIAFSKCGGAGNSADGLIFHCTFDDEASITTPAVGPAGAVSSRQFIKGKVGNAVRVPKGSSAGFFSLPAGTFGEEGCIEFWAKLEPWRENYGDCDPRMVFIKSPAGWFTVEYSANNGAGRGGFYVRCFGISYLKGGSWGRAYRYSDIIEDVTGWHHYAFSWSKDTLTAYIDGKKLEGMYKVEGDRIDGAKLQKSYSVMGLPCSNANQYNTEPNSPFVMDELKIWNYAKQDFDL